MALANKGTPAPTRPAFEAEEDDVGAAAAAQAAAPAPAEAPRPPAVQPPAAQSAPANDPVASAPPVAAPAPMAVAPRPAGGALAQANPNRPIPLIRRLENAEPSLAGIQMGTFPRVTLDLSGYAVNKTEKQLGSWIEFEVISWNELTIVTHGKNNATADDNKKMRTSVDHVWLQDGSMTVADYVKFLKVTEGYDTATSKKYLEVFGVVTASDKGGVVSEADQGLHQLSLSPQSVVKWQGFMATAAWKASKGGDQGDRVKIRMGFDPKMIGTNKFAVANFAFAA